MTLEPAASYTLHPTLAPEPIHTHTLKIGGVPVFMEANDLPVCAQCGNPMGFIAQIPLQTPLSFSDNYQMAYIFICIAGEGTCSTWAPNEGANAVILQAGEGTFIESEGQPDYPDYAIALQPEAETAEGEDKKLTGKLGGTPDWIQGDEFQMCPHCERPMQFVAQVDFYLDGEYELPFGDSGMGYTFLCPDSCTPQSAVFLWQCF
jgi:uncharacterized protein YwqG